VRQNDHLSAGTANTTPDPGEDFRWATWLRAMIEQVNPDEFYWQDAHYDHHSEMGRELLFLMANHEWVRATSEIVDISRSDAVETTIKIDIDPGQITHEAFRKRTGLLWLPVTVLPPQAEKRHPGPGRAIAESGPRRLEPDPFATVASAEGNLLPMLSAADLRHQMSAAMAEIIAKMAVSHLPGSAGDQTDTNAADQPGAEPPIASRDQRLLLSAAIARLLEHGSSPSRPSPESTQIIATRRMIRARQPLLDLLDYYIEQLDPERVSVRRPQFTPELAHRAIRVLRALAESIIVVVPVAHDAAPTVLTVRVPTRKLAQTSEVNWRKWSTWLIRPAGHLEIDVLLPTADADRQIQVNLPAGVTIDEPADRSEPAGREFPHLDIGVHAPPTLLELSAAMKQVSGPHDPRWPTELVEALVDLARVKSAAALETLQHYDASYQSDPLTRIATGKPHIILKQLAGDLHRLTPISDGALRRFDEMWRLFKVDKLCLSRRTVADRLSPQTVAARADMIEDISQRAVPRQAKIYVDVTVDDRDYFSIARSSAFMSLILMAGVLCFLLFWPEGSPKPEVLAIVLTLFAVVQAGRIERPDRSTLQGQLFAFGNWLIALSMLPPVILAVALAFREGGPVADYWAAGCIVLQSILLFFMKWGPLTPAGSSGIGQRHEFKTDSLEYRHFEALRSDYWRTTTADALMIGRMAHGYVIWQQTRQPDRAGELTSPQLVPLLTQYSESAESADSNNILALLHSSTQRLSITFTVFRGEPGKNWDKPEGDVYKIKGVDLDPDRLGPMDNVTSRVDVFVGVYHDELPTIAAHPLVTTLRAAKNKLIILEAQLPVPAPVDGHYDKQWARMRVALRDTNDIDRLTEFLGDVHQEITQDRGPRGMVVVQTAPIVPPRVITAPVRAPSPNPADTNQTRFYTGDLDTSNILSVKNDRPHAFTWRVVTMCADARSNIGSDIIQYLPLELSHYELAHLNYTLLHGVAAIIVLAHKTRCDEGVSDLSFASRSAQEKQRDPANSGADLEENAARSRLQILINEPVSRTQLGPMTQSPLVRIRFRWHDRPGALCDVLGSIKASLANESPAIDARNSSISYARLLVARGRISLGYLNIRTHSSIQQEQGWNQVKREQLGRKIAIAAALAAANRRDSNSPEENPDDLEKPVIRIDLISKDVPPESGRAE
jgi:hypothetical protein